MSEAWHEARPVVKLDLALCAQAFLVQERKVDGKAVSLVPDYDFHGESDCD